MDPITLMADIIAEHTPASIWTGSPLEGYRRLGNTNRGQIGESFVRRYLTDAGIAASNGSRSTPTDLTIAGARFEIKTASLGERGTFQFNHVRLDRDYQFPLALGRLPRRHRVSGVAKGRLVGRRGGKAGSHGGGTKHDSQANQAPNRDETHPRPSGLDKLGSGGNRLTTKLGNPRINQIKIKGITRSCSPSS